MVSGIGKAPVHLGSIDRILFEIDDNYFCYCSHVLHLKFLTWIIFYHLCWLCCDAASVLCFGLLTATHGASFLPDQGLNPHLLHWKVKSEPRTIREVRIINYFWAMLCLCCCMRAASGCGERGFSRLGASLVLGLLSSQGAGLGLTRFSSSDMEADLLHGTWCLPGQGVEPPSPAFPGGLLAPYN